MDYVIKCLERDLILLERQSESGREERQRYVDRIERIDADLESDREQREAIEAALTVLRANRADG